VSNPASGRKSRRPAGRIAGYSSAAAAPAKAEAPQTVTYVVQGSSAQVTYRPDGSSLNGTVPMRVTRPLGHPQYYSISAQLNVPGRSCAKS